jgi:brefeldin A-inhibited guanine nucleotide-exchange protein
LYASREFLSKRRIGEYLGNSKDFNQKVLGAYCTLLGGEFVGLKLDESLRVFLKAFRLPGEAQQIDRILQQFAHAFYNHNKEDGDFANADVAYVLAFSIIMLNTDLHNASIVANKKMTLEQFLSNNRGINEVLLPRLHCCLACTAASLALLPPLHCCLACTPLTHFFVSRRRTSPRTCLQRCTSA